MKKKNKTFLVWIAFFVVFLVAYFLLTSNNEKITELSYTEFLEKVGNNQVIEATLAGPNLTGILADNTKIKTRVPDNPEDPDFFSLLKEKNIKITIKEPNNNSFIVILVNLLPILLIIGFVFFIIRRTQKGAENTKKGLTSNQARQTKSTTTFADVAGLDEVKKETQEIITFLKHPTKFTRLGARPPKGVILVGPPGCGKTLLARAVAGEADVPFYSISGSDFVEVFVGVGAGRVRSLFKEAKKTAPCIIFIDELDAVGRSRGAGVGGGHDEREQTLNQILVEMDGFEPNTNIVVIAATNRPDILDSGLLRPGRFDRHIVIPVPNLGEREAILKVHARRVPLAEDVDLSRIAKLTPYFTGADLENLVNEAAILAAREDAEKVTLKHFNEARDKVIMGLTRKIPLDEKEKQIVAYHEAGHTLVARLVPEADLVEKVSIIPRGMALGVTLPLPIKERHLPSKLYMMSKLSTFLGGRLAEKMIFGQEEITGGAKNDLERATQLARKMVCEFGMGSISFRTFGEKQGEVFLGRELTRNRDYSEKTAQLIDKDIESILTKAQEIAEKILTEHRASLDKLAQTLLEKETLEADEIDEILNIKK